MEPSPSSLASRRRAELSAQGSAAHAAAVQLVESLGQVDPEDLPERTPSRDLRTLDGELAILGGLMRERLRGPGELDPGTIAALSQTLHEVHQVRFAIHDHLGHERLRRLDRLDRGLTRLRRVTDQDELLAMACEAAADSGGFERVMLSRIDEGEWQPWRSYATRIGAPERTFGDWIAGLPRIRLSHMMLESELVRRREAAIVEDAATDSRVYPPLAKASELASFVAAPIMSGDRVIGLLHADNGDAGVVELDREILWFFAIGFGQIFERAVLLARLRDQRAEVMKAMGALEAALEELASSEIDLATREETTALAVSRPVRPVASERPSVLDDLLTNRELEVLALMATGATNERIAQRLVIATGTVKSHVKQILRKLRVDNRAEAISQYLRLTIGAREDG